MNTTSTNTSQPLTIIKASAGSGKTYTLAKRYIEYLFFARTASGKLKLRTERNYHRHILAITFTNKATDEMKDRIVQELYTLSSTPSDSKYLDDFKRDLECNGDKERKIKKQAQKALSDLLMNYSLFNVSTIDAFFQNILRTFARELNHNSDYELQINSDYAVAVAVNNFLLALGDTRRRTGTHLSPVEQWVRDMIDRSVEDNKSWRDVYKGEGLRQLCKQLTNDTFLQSIDAIREYFKDPNNPGKIDISKINQFLKVVAAEIGKADAAVKNKATQVQNDLNNIIKRHGLTTFKKRALDNFSNNIDDIIECLTGAKSNSFLKNEPTEDSVKNLLTKPKLPLDDVVVSLEKLRNDILQFGARYQLLKQLHKALGNLGLIGALDKEMTRFRHETNSIMLSDTNDLISRLLQYDVVFMYEHTGTTINHYMIDEFQDTNVKQYENFRPLLEESFSHSDEPVDLIIGDSKQAIYRFRGAEPELFQSRLEQETAGKYVNEPLSVNRRSLKSIVTFNNALIGELIKPYGNLLTDTYVGPDPANPEYVQEYDPRFDGKGQGLVRVITTPMQSDGESMKEGDACDCVLDMLPAYLLDIRQRAGNWKRIGILVNTKDEGRKVVEAIVRHNDRVRQSEPLQRGDIIEVSSDESMLLSSSPSVKIIIGLLRFLDLTKYATGDEDGEADDATAKRPSKHERRQRMYALFNNFVNALRKDAEAAASADGAGEILSQCVEALNGQNVQQVEQEINALLPRQSGEQLTLLNIVERLIDRFVLRAGSSVDVPFLLALEDVVSQFLDSRSGSTIHEFLRYWDARKDSLSLDSGDDADAVRVMTIHKSKGLEFDYVVVPFAWWLIQGCKPIHYNEPVWVTAEQFRDNRGDILLPLDEVKDCIPPLLPMPWKYAYDLHRASGNVFLDAVLAPQLRDEIIDLMNKTYVTLTRPKCELHLFTLLSDKDRKDELTEAMHVSTLINDAVQRLGEEGNELGLRRVASGDVANMLAIYARLKRAQKNGDQAVEAPVVWSDDAVWWTMGEEYSPKEDDQNSAESIRIDIADLSHRPVDVRVKLPTADAARRPIDVGLIVHRAMERVVSRDDVESAVRSVADDVVALGPDSGITVDWLTETVRNMVNNPPATAVMEDGKQPVDSHADTWWDPANVVFNERSVVTSDLVKRPDRVVLRPDGTLIVIDFKTGDKRDEHVKQVEEYVDMLTKALSPKAVEGYLWYTDSVIVRVR